MGICSICSGGETTEKDKNYEIIRENKKEMKNSSNLSSEIKSHNEVSKSNHVLNDQILQKILEDNPSIEKRITIIQSMMKKYKLRNIYMNIRNKVRKNEEYFSYKEAFETLSKNLLSDLSISNYEYKYKNGSVYNGNWLGGFRHGKGKMIWIDGTFYEGDWFYGHAEGDGCLYFNNGSYLKGDFRYNKLNGKGECFQSDLNYKYEGEFMNNEQNGEGIENWNDDFSEYVGLFSNGQKELFGKYFWNDGSYYIGEWNNNKINGYVSILKLMLFILYILYIIHEI
jgi:L1 cell adhesion molecule like protein